MKLSYILWEEILQHFKSSIPTISGSMPTGRTEDFTSLGQPLPFSKSSDQCFLLSFQESW